MSNLPVFEKLDGTHISYVFEITNSEFKQYLYNMERANDKLIQKREKDMTKELRRIFERTLKRIETNIDGYYKRYADREGISIAEARKRASEFDVRKYEARAKKAVKERDFSDETNEWLRLYNLKMRASREEVMLAQLRLDLLEMYDDIEIVGKRFLTNEALREVERQSGILNGQPIAKEQVIELVNSEAPHGNFSKNVWAVGGHYDVLQKELTNILADLRVDMDGYRKKWKELAKRMNVAESNAKRLVINEERRILHQTDLRMYEENGFDSYVFVSETDSKTCPHCAELNGLTFKQEDASAGVNFPLVHVNCRCSTFGYAIMKRFNLDTGQWEVVGADMGLGLTDALNDPIKRARTGRYAKMA